MRYAVLIFLLFGFKIGFSQSVEGVMSNLKNETITLYEFKGLEAYPVSSTKTDNAGNFKLPYVADNIGMGFLESEDKTPFILILSGEDIKIKGEALSQPAGIRIVKGGENQHFETYAIEHPRREQALNAWVYLQRMYVNDTLFSSEKESIKLIQNEKERIEKEDSLYIAELPKDSYVRWFMPVRKLVSSVSTVAKYRPEEMPETIEAFRNIDYADSRLYKSGLLKDAIEGHFWLLENSGKDLNAVYQEMKISIDRMLETLVKDEQILNEATDYLFDLLERHSLFEASEYLAVKV